MAINLKNPFTIRILFWIGAALAGFIQSWANRYAMNSDGTSYLDMGSAYLRGDWGVAINAYFSPLYSVLLGAVLFVLKPSSEWEFPVVHLVNYAIFLFALACFEVLLRRLIHFSRSAQLRIWDGTEQLPDWVWYWTGYPLFLWCSLGLVGLARGTPLMWVVAMLCLSTALLLEIHHGAKRSIVMYGLYGMILGFGYLSKTVMFLIGWIYLGIGSFLSVKGKSGLVRPVTAILCFLAISAPLIIPISKTTGRLSFGESGRLNYLWCVNGGAHHCDSKPAPHVITAGQLYDYSTKLGVTYPYWYDASYWCKHLDPHFDFAKQVKVFVKNFWFFLKLFFEMDVLLIGFLFLFYLGLKRLPNIKDLLPLWPLFLCSVVPMVMYSLVSVENRLIAGFILPFWGGLFLAIRTKRSLALQEDRACATAVIFTLVFLLMARLISPMHIALLNLRLPKSLSQSQVVVAERLKAMGLKEGDRVAHIGLSFQAYWARLGRFEIVGEWADRNQFWQSSAQVQEFTLRVFEQQGVKAVIADISEGIAKSPNWEKVYGDTHALWLSKTSVSSRISDGVMNR
jgi:hypothetical protein